MEVRSSLNDIRRVRRGDKIGGKKDQQEGEENVPEWC
jgi:hypothetical protein